MLSSKCQAPNIRYSTMHLSYYCLVSTPIYWRIFSRIVSSTIILSRRYYIYYFAAQHQMSVIKQAPHVTIRRISFILFDRCRILSLEKYYLSYSIARLSLVGRYHILSINRHQRYIIRYATQHQHLLFNRHPVLLLGEDCPHYLMGVERQVFVSQQPGYLLSKQASNA